MSEPLLDRLCRVSGLDREDVEFLAAFDDAQLTALIEAYEHGRDKRERDLKVAVDDGLKIVPFVVRPAVKKVLFS